MFLIISTIILQQHPSHNFFIDTQEYTLLLIHFSLYVLITLFVGLLGLLFLHYNLFRYLLLLEVMYLAIICLFLLPFLFFNNTAGLVYAILILGNTAAEAAIGLSLLVAAYRIKRTLVTKQFSYFNN
jgi:NADH:ubiquinone oxidoreductase subunit K